MLSYRVYAHDDKHFIMLLDTKRSLNTIDPTLPTHVCCRGKLLFFFFLLPPFLSLTNSCSPTVYSVQQHSSSVYLVVAVFAIFVCPFHGHEGALVHALGPWPSQGTGSGGTVVLPAARPLRKQRARRRGCVKRCPRLRLAGSGIDKPRVLVVVKNGRIAGVPVVPHPSPLQASQLADHAISGFLSPKFPRVSFIPPRGKFQLLLPQP